MSSNRNNFVFFGTPRFAEIVLKLLISDGMSPSLVVCNPDRPVGRKKIITPPPVKILAETHGIPVLQPESLTGYRLPVTRYNAGFALLAAYGKIIPKDIIELFPKGIIGIHPSLLPKYRGAAPIQSAILAGENETGVTLFLIDEKVDHGGIISNVKSQISNLDTYISLEEKLAKLSAELVLKTVPGYLVGEIQPREQNHNEVTFTKKIAADDAFVPYENLEAALGGDEYKSIKIDRLVRALNPEPGVWTLKPPADGGKRMKILEVKIIDGKIVLTKIQMEGKAPQIIKY